MTTTDQAAARADELYRIHVAHLLTCALCLGGRDCDTDRRMRRAVSAARRAAGGRRPRSAT